MKLSKYNQYYQDGNNLLVLGGISRAFIEFEDTTKDTLLQKILMLTNDEQEYLKEYEIIVSDDTNEYESFLKKFNRWRSSTKELTITIGLTFACNFNCKYCIQKENYSERNSITQNKADIILAWVEDAISSKTECLNVNYFGGEPTLNIEMLYYLSERFSNLCTKKGITYYQQIVTNGYALNEEKLKQLQNLGLHDYQITLDGLAEVHNNRRSRTFDSFSRIVDNIITITDLDMRLFLLHVFDISNQNSAIELVDYFDRLAQEHKGLRKNVTFNFVPTIPKRVESVECNKYIDGNETVLSGLATSAFKHAIDKRFQIANFMDIGHCFRQARNTLLVSPSLDIYKCYGTFGNERYSIGNMSDMKFHEFQTASKSICDANGFSEKCIDCDVVPFCRGGCQFSASESNDGKYGVAWCERDTIIKSVQGYMINRMI